jgi:pimeloyl-ACP methyl ester carboxylesterase
MNNGIYKTKIGKIKILEFYDKMLAKWPIEVTETDIMTDVGTTHVLVAGNPDLPPLVLLHGSTSNAATWLSDFKTYSRDFCVYAIDMPGEPGKSTETRLSWKNDEYSEWLLQVTDALNLVKPSLVGLSLGGWVAMRFASRYPERTGNIALIAPGGLVDPNMKAILKLVKYQKEGEKGVEKTLKLLFPDDFESPEVVEFFTLIGQHFSTRVEALPKLSNEIISGIKSHVFLICGAKDAIFNFRKATKRILKLLPKAEAQLFEGGTHGMVNMADAILPFLKR